MTLAPPPSPRLVLAAAIARRRRTAAQAEAAEAARRSAAEHVGPPATDDELHAWIADALGIRIPRSAVCDGHEAPFEFVADVYFGRVADAVVLANRAGGKTQSFAALHVANARWKPRYETTHFGAIMAQAGRCARYVRRLAERPAVTGQHITFRGLPGGGEEGIWRATGSSIEILPATENQTQGGHPVLVAFDELDQARRQPYENATGMAEEYTDAEGHRWPGQFVRGSTRATGLGMMQAALDAAEREGHPVYTWCVFETMEPCDGAEGRHACDGRACPLSRWCIGGEADEHGQMVEAEHHCEQDAALGLHGRAVHADGWRSYEQILAVYGRAGADTWEAQHLCRKPEARALIYSTFGAENITEAAVYVPGAGPLMLSYDWGFTDQTHIILWQYRDQQLFGLAEFVGSQTSEREWVRAVIRHVCALPGYDGLSMEDWEQVWAGRAPWPNPWPDTWPEIAGGDPSAAQLARELRDHGIRPRGAKRTTHRVVSGQAALRALILAGTGRRLFVHPSLRMTIRGLTNYRAKQNADGTFAETPDPDPANHAYSHGCDSARYLAWAERRRFGIVLGSADAEEDDG